MLRPVLLQIVVCLSLQAAILPPRRIAEPPIVPSIHGQSSVSLASNGDGAFAVWTDYRTLGYGALFGTRLSADGTVLDPTGILIDEDDGQSAAVVWTGSEYAAIGAQMPRDPYARQRLFLHRLDANGRVLQRRIPLGEIDIPRLASNGSDEIAIGGDSVGGSTVSFFSAQGHAIATRRVGTYAPVPVSDGGDWFAFAQDEVCAKKFDCKLVLKQYRFEDGHTVAKESTLFDYTRDPASLAVASNGAGRFALVWVHTETKNIFEQQYRRRVFYAVADREGRLITGPIRMELADVDVHPSVGVWGSILYHPPRVMWDGQHFIVTWKWFDGTGASAIHASRLDADGNRVNAFPISFGSSAIPHIRTGSPPVAVKTGSHLLVGWGANSTIREALVLGATRAVRSFEELATEQPPALLTWSAVEQGGAEIAANDRAAFAVFLEDGVTYGRLLPWSGRAPERVAISLPSARRPTHPAVAWNGGVFVVVWREIEEASRGPVADHLYLRRYDGEGRAIDPAPVRLAIESVGELLPPQLHFDIGWDGTRFLAVWSSASDGAVHGVRIPVSGKVLDRVPLVLSKPSSVRTGGPKLAWTGSEYVLFFYEDATPTSNGGAPLPILPHLGRMTRVSTEGKVLDTTYPVAVTIRGGFDLYRSSFEPSWNGRELLVTWATVQTTFAPFRSCAYAQRFTSSGVEVDPDPVELLCQDFAAGFSSHTNPRPLWDGTSWWLYYSKVASDGGLFLAPLSGTRLGEPVRLLDRTSRPGAANAIWTPAGLVFVYTAADDRYGRVTGAFWSRVISPRTRTVRR